MHHVVNLCDYSFSNYLSLSRIGSFCYKSKNFSVGREQSSKLTLACLPKASYNRLGQVIF